MLRLALIISTLYFSTSCTPVATINDPFYQLTAVNTVPVQHVDTSTVIVPPKFEAIPTSDNKILVRKKSFATLHPKLHAAGRKIRKYAQIAAPIVQVAGSVAQVVTSIK